ncbi:MAG: helix-hairpin-helix domain-containing protein [Minisyncoccota bacterium]
MRSLATLSFALLLPLCAFFSFGISATAATLVNINTADATTLDTLPGIGPSKAAAIVEYRQEHGAFVRIEDIQNVSGIGPSTFANIQSLITVGDTAADTSDTATDTAASSTQSTANSPGAASTYTPPPSGLTLDVGTDRSAFLEVPLHFSASVKSKGGAIDSSARILWSFGDGSSGEGSAVEKTYRYAGTYVVKAMATDGAAGTEDEFTVVVRPAALRIVAVSGDGITIANDASERLDLSGWRLTADIGFFRIPEGTLLLPKTSVLFPSSITNLPVALDAILAYPDGVVAARYPTPTSTPPAESMQPFAPVASSTEEQTVGSVFSSGVSDTAHEVTAVGAPTAAEPAAVGAALSALSAIQKASAASAPPSGIFGSLWFYALLGVIVLAGGAFILL